MDNKKNFQPKSGQVDYTNIRWAPVINCVVKHGDKILIVRRSSKLKFHPGWWNGLGGFLDDNKNLEEKVEEEIREETGISAEDIISIKIGEIFDEDDTKFGKTWIVHPVLAEVKTDKVVLDWEAEDYRWIKPEELTNFKITAGFKKVVRNFFPSPKMVRLIRNTQGRQAHHKMVRPIRHAQGKQVHHNADII